MSKITTIFSAYDQFFCSSLTGRYITLEHIEATCILTCSEIEYSIIGTSENSVEIPMIKIGNGGKKVLGWSQMHGNESTTTKAVMDFVSFCVQKEFFQDDISTFFDTYSLYLIPILNPDGALLYTRENINGVDLNRDAKLKTQNESKILATMFDTIQPDICLNLHDQRTIYGAEKGLPATVSFLAPAADPDRSVTGARKVAMGHIERMHRRLSHFIPGQIGRYNDQFNENCVGDTFQMKGVPTILFEAGHYSGDYNREETRKYIFLALLELFCFDSDDTMVMPRIDYTSIPENNKNFRDVLLRNIMDTATGNLLALALQFEEILVNGRIKFQGVIDCIGDPQDLMGHLEVDVKGASILVDSQEFFEIGQDVSMICSKTDPSVVYFSMK